MDFTPGHILQGKYRIEAQIGAGAFGQVYRATHLQLEVTRALKVLRRDAPGVGSSDYQNAIQRFRLEAQLGARLKSEYLVQAHDFEQFQDKLVLVSEYCPGGNLSGRLEKYSSQGQSMPLVEAIKITFDLAKGLAVLHAQDVVHRDLKPSNILFSDDGRAKVADLGLAQVPGGPSMRSRLSQPSLHPGTPIYMSPEQENGLQHLRPTSDVYTLGIVLFEMLTGRNYNNLKPGTKLGEFRQDCPHWLDDVLSRMLHQAYQERPWDGDVVARELKSGLDELLGQENDRQQLKIASGLAQKGKTEQSDRRVRQLAEDIQANIVDEQWHLVERLLVQLEELVPEGQMEADRLRAKVKQAKQTALVQENQASAPDLAKSNQLFTDGKHGLEGGNLMQAKSQLEQMDRLEAESREPIHRIMRNLQVTTLAKLMTILNPYRKSIMVLLLVLIVSIGIFGVRFFTGKEHTNDPDLAMSIEATEKSALIAHTVPVVWGPANMEWVYISAGSFLMGSNPEEALVECQKFRMDCDLNWFEDETPIHEVYLDSYYMNLYEVTNNQYADFLNDMGNQSEGSSNWLKADSGDVLIEFVAGEWRPKRGYDDHPVVMVTWYGAQAYCEWAGGRLPTEAEWEKAARGGLEGKMYPWGDEAPLGTHVNYCDANCEYGWRDLDINDGYRRTAPVGSYKPNGYGLYDMAGNVWEWVADWYSGSYYARSPGINPTGPETGFARVMRGGSYSHDLYRLRNASRFRLAPDETSYYGGGFRCAR